MPMSSLKNVIIVGAGGRLGPHILRAIDSDSRLKVSILSRISSTSTFPSHIKVHKIGDDYPQAELVKAFSGQDAVISTLATASAEVQKKLIDAAVQAGVKRFVPSEFGSDVRNEKGLAIIPQYFKGKTDTVDYLNSKENEGLTWTTFVTGSFFEMAIKMGYMGFDLQNRKATLIDDGLGKWSTTTLSTVGLAVGNAMIESEATANKIVYVASFTVSQKEVLTALEKLTGSTWEVTNVDGEQQKKAGQEKMSKGDFSGAPLLLSYINCVEGHGGNFATYNETSNETLHLPKESLDEVLKGIVNESKMQFTG